MEGLIRGIYFCTFVHAPFVLVERGPGTDDSRSPLWHAVVPEILGLQKSCMDTRGSGFLQSLLSRLHHFVLLADLERDPRLIVGRRGRRGNMMTLLYFDSEGLAIE